MEQNELYRAHLENITRRHFFGRSARGLGTIALASLLNRNLFAAGNKAAKAAAGNPFPSHGTINPLHFAPKAKRVIYLFQSGAPSQLDLYDWDWAAAGTLCCNHCSRPWPAARPLARLACSR